MQDPDTVVFHYTTALWLVLQSSLLWCSSKMSIFCAVISEILLQMLHHHCGCTLPRPPIGNTLALPPQLF